MSTFRERLAQAANKNRELLFVLNQTDYAPPAAKQNTAYIADLLAQASSTDKELLKLHTSTEQERKDHAKYQDSVTRRYLHKMGGSKAQEKYTAKQEKEERNFLVAWQREREAQEHRDQLNRAIDQARKEKRTIDADQSRHDKAQTDLEQMYRSIFEGPTPDVPGEDQMEQAVGHTKDWYQQCQSKLVNEQRALQDLHRADVNLSKALRDMGNANDMSNLDRFGGGSFTDMMERDALSAAQVKLTQCLRTMEGARRSQPAIGQLSAVTIDQEHMVSDVLFDNIFTDMAQHDRIRDSTAQMQKAMTQLHGMVSEQKQRVQDVMRQCSQASQELEEARKELQRIRSEAFERLAGEGRGYEDENSAPPPPY